MIDLNQLMYIQPGLSRKIRVLLRSVWDFDVNSLESQNPNKGCTLTLYMHYFGNTGTVHKFYHNDGSMPENDNFDLVGLKNTVSSWRCSCTTLFLDISKLQ